MFKKALLLVCLCCSFTGVLRTLPDNDKATLMQMREEEKLARDLYRTLNEKWHQMPFEHIVSAEVTHMQEVKSLMDTYKVDDPVVQTDDQQGRFVNARFQEIYDSLTVSGVASLENAFRAGAYVEELDILDLRNAIEGTRVKDLAVTYRYLVQASEQHLRAFAHNLQRLGVTYQPVVLSQEEFEKIVSTGGPGKGAGMGKGPGAMEGCDPSCPHKSSGGSQH